MSGEGIYGGMQVDIRTGLPIEKKESERQALEEKKLESDVAASLAVKQQLASPSGEFFVGVVTEALERRMDELANADPIASTLLSILTTIGGKIHIGQASAKRLALTRLKRENTNL